MTSDPPSPSDEDLARQTQAGSMDAFEDLVSRYERRIYAFVMQSCRNATDAAELTQETFVKAYQAISQFDSKRTFAPWLFTIARRKCVDHFRAIRPISNDSPLDLLDTNDPAELLAHQDERQHLWNLARRLLPESQFDALWLHYVEDMNLAEVARVLHRPQTYLKVLLFRARKTLAERLKATPVDAESPPYNLPHAYEIPVR
jgi:RNA polymerase sigma-70 factor (ECF subfamily)